MKPSKLIILTGVLVVLGLAAWWITNSKDSGTPESAELRGSPMFGEVDFNKADSIEIATADGAINLARQDNQWVVTDREGFPANQERIVAMLTKFNETKITQAMKAGGSQDERMELLPPDSEEGDAEAKATRVTFKEGDKEFATLLIGKDHVNEASGIANPTDQSAGRTSRYVRVSSRPGFVLEVPDQFSELLSGSGWPYSFAGIVAKPGEWLDKENFIKIEKIKSISVTFKEEGKEGYTLTREKDTGDFTLVESVPEGKELDSTKTSSFKTLLSSASFEDVLTAEEAEKLDLSQATEATITTFNGFTYNLTLGPKDEEDNHIPVKFAVSGEFPQERTVEEGKEETEEEKTKAEEDFKADIKARQDKLAQEKKLEGRWYALSSYRVDALLKSRADLLKDEEEEIEDAPEDGSAATPPGERKPVTAVTPPIQIPPPGLPTEASRSGDPAAEAKKPVEEAVTDPIRVPAAGEAGRIETVTPPVAVPPLPDEDAGEAAAEDETPPAETSEESASGESPGDAEPAAEDDAEVEEAAPAAEDDAQAEEPAEAEDGEGTQDEQS